MKTALEKHQREVVKYSITRAALQRTILQGFVSFEHPAQIFDPRQKRTWLVEVYKKL